MFVLILSTVLIQMAFGEECPTAAQLATDWRCGTDCVQNILTYLKLEDGTECPGCNCHNLALKEDGSCPDIFCDHAGRTCDGGQPKYINQFYKAEDGQICPVCEFKGCW